MSGLKKTGYIEDGKFIYEKEKYGEIEIKEIKVDFKKNVRHSYNAQELDELASSIKSQGQLQPIGIDEKDNLVYGFRRYKAIKEILKQTKIKYVRVSFDNLDVVQLVENIQRDDLKDYELASSLSKLKEELKLTNKELALKLNKTEKWIEDKIKHSDLINETASHVDVGTLEILKQFPTSKVNETRKLSPKERVEVLTSGKTQKQIRNNVTSKSHVNVGKKNKPETLQDRKYTKKQLESQIVEIDSQIVMLATKRKEIVKQIKALSKK